VSDVNVGCLVSACRNVMANSKLEFKVYNDLTSQREVVGQGSIDLFQVMQKHRSKSMYFCPQESANINIFGIFASHCTGNTGKYMYHVLSFC